VDGMDGLAAWQLGNGQLCGLAAGGLGQGRGEESIVVLFCPHVLSWKLTVSCVASRSLHRVCTGFFAVTTVVCMPAS
jgi:hypothetical protein